MARKSGAESKSAWFRSFYRENPDFVRGGSNEEVLDLWRTAHPGQEPDESIRNVMSNVKSSVKKELSDEGGRKKRGSRSATATVATQAETVVATVNTSARRQLEELELALDQCLIMALTMDNPSLEKAIRHLRRARNLVVWQQGEPS